MPAHAFLPAFWAKLTDRKSTRLNSSHTVISYAVFCLKKHDVSPIFSSPRRRGTVALASRDGQDVGGKVVVEKQSVIRDDGAVREQGSPDARPERAQEP